MIRREYDLFADYFQFYIQDDDPQSGDLSDVWTEDANKRMLAVARGFMGFATARNMTVHVVVEVLDGEPADDTNDWQHVVDGGMEVKTGRVVVAGCTDYLPDADRIPIHPGVYRARMSCRGLDTVCGLNGNDQYRVQLWLTSELTKPTVLKQGSSR